MLQFSWYKYLNQLVNSGTWEQLYSHICPHFTYVHRNQSSISCLQPTLGNPGSLLYTTHLCQTGLVMLLSNTSTLGWPFDQSSHKYIIKAPVISRLHFWWCINIIHHQDAIGEWWINGIHHQSSVVAGMHYFPAGSGKTKSMTNNVFKDFL